MPCAEEMLVVALHQASSEVWPGPRSSAYALKITSSSVNTQKYGGQKKQAFTHLDKNFHHPFTKERKIL